MPDKPTLAFDNICTQTIKASWLNNNGVQLDVLRLDRLHPVVSGNKWFKLQFHIARLINQYSARTVATFGGAYSNHIIATAFACRMHGLPCVGFIRGEQPQQLSHTLTQARDYGMQLYFVSRNEYRNKTLLEQAFPDYYWIPEGGYSIAGAEGAATILQHVPSPETYTHLIAAVGTGTMLAGLVMAAIPGLQITGISALKGNTGAAHSVNALLPAHLHDCFSIDHRFHFGGYAKHPPELLDYMTRCWNDYALPLDMVYTAKAFFATEQLINEHTIAPGSRVLFIHSGGLQGNLSLAPGLLPF
ncbi:1-aminocyclopropane-1-carboxylate deaminase/D-cysteine desulfhydrase [Deminuibacter soli]|uniref:Pyridoxal-phosphate dependent enzyme n=1 Tax=Deminuibacter soli TaxID=2291815 RepID=A0A3E1NLE6_9BACT|nr:pyridoxal-phosphate dependent enzyme [Deminuibacter soli]RFM28746.1 pyridoxal-phosphate dependent enzyme [Deminuibacter soli]